MESIPELHPANRGWDSQRLARSDADPPIVAALHEALARAAPDGRALDAAAASALRVPFLHATFEGATFIYLYRDPRHSLVDAAAAWESGVHLGAQPPGWTGPHWSLALTPEWRALQGHDIPEVVAAQWAATTRMLVGDLRRLPPERWMVLAHEHLAEDPQRELARVASFAGLEPPGPRALALSPPAPLPDAFRAVLATTDRADAGARALIATPEPVTRTPESPLRSVNTTSLPEVLEQIGASLLISTYQTNKLVVARRAGRELNTHFRALDGPMGLALRGDRLAVGTRSEVIEYRDVPAVAPRLDGPVPHDACFVPRRTHNTGDVRIHDLAFAGDELWFVATRFSCLATLDERHSFVPRWRPPFISELAAEDRCHLNGMCVIDDEVRYVTALGATDTPGGWRERRADGGVLIDVRSGETVAAGLSMPHSPRWHRGQLWALESGDGSLGTVDPATGRYEAVARVPGFTRGLSLYGSFAFVGLSEVREANTFGGLPLTARLEDRQCGVWVIDIELGETVAFLRFEDVVEELFEVLLLPGLTFPEIAEPGSETATTSFVVPGDALNG